MENSKQAGPNDPRFLEWFNDLEDKHRTKWVYSLCRHVWQNISYAEFELWFDNNAQDLYRRAADLEQSEMSELDASSFQPFSPPGRLPLGFQEMWDMESLSDRTLENWKWIRSTANATTFQRFIIENPPYRTRFEALQDLHIREHYAAQGKQVPRPQIVGGWHNFIDELPAKAATTEFLNEVTNTIRRTRHVPPGVWWANINPIPSTPNAFVDALCWRFLAEVNHYRSSQELYPFRHSTYLGIRLPNRWRDWWANADTSYRTSYLWRYAMANLDRDPQEMVQALENDMHFRQLAFREEVEQISEHENLGTASQQLGTYYENSNHGEQGDGQAAYGTGDSTAFDSTPYESTPYGSEPLGLSPGPYQNPFQRPASSYRAPNLQQPPPEGYSCLSNSVADAAPGQREPKSTRRAARLFNARNKPRMIGTSGRPLQGVANYGWWGKYVDDGPRKHDETVEQYVERVNRARDNMRIQLRLRPDPPLRGPDESIEQHSRNLQVFEDQLKWNEELHNNKMNDSHPQFDQIYRDNFQRTARSVHDENEARRNAARQYWDAEVTRLHYTGGQKHLKTAELYRKRYRSNEVSKADLWNLYEGWTDEDMRKGEWPPSTDEEDPNADDDDGDDEPRSAIIKCSQCQKARQECSGIQYGTPTWNVWPCERCCTVAGGKYAERCGPRFSNALQIANRKQKIKNSSTRGPYLVSWWARELSDVPRAPPPPDHWAVRVRKTFIDFPRPVQAAPATQPPLFARPTQTPRIQGVVTPSGAESGSTGAVSKGSRGLRSDRGKKHKYPATRQRARPKPQVISSRDTSRSRSASPSRGLYKRPYRNRSPVISTRRCQRCEKRNRMCSAQNVSERPCQECIHEGPEVARFCIGRTVRNNGPAPGPGHYRSSGGHRGMGPGGQNSYDSYTGPRGGNQPGYSGPGRFEGSQPYNTQNRPGANTPHYAKGSQELLDEEERRRREWDERVPDAEEIRVFDEFMKEQARLAEEALEILKWNSPLGNGPQNDFLPYASKPDQSFTFQYVADPENLPTFLDQVQYDTLTASGNLVPLPGGYPSFATPAEELLQAAVAISSSQVNQYDPPWDAEEEEYIPPIDPALLSAVPELGWDIAPADILAVVENEVPPLTAPSPDTVDPPTPFDDLDDEPAWKINVIDIAGPGTHLDEAECTEDLNAEADFFFQGEILCGRPQAPRCQNKDDTKNATCRVCHDDQVTGADAEETSMLDSSKALFCEACQRDLENARRGQGQGIKGLRFRKCHCFMQLQDTWLCNPHRKQARQQVVSQIALMQYMKRAKEGKCGRCQQNEGTVRETWKCIACENVVLAHA